MSTREPCRLIAEYIAAAGLEKQSLNYALHEGVNRFTILSPDANEFLSQAIIGLYLFSSNEVPDFTEGSRPTLAAVDDGGLIDALGFSSCGFVDGDATYFQAETNYFVNGTLTAQVGMYDVTITY